MTEIASYLAIQQRQVGKMSVKEMTRVSLLATLLFIIYSCGSLIMYVELFNFTVLLYSVTLPKKQSFLIVLLFCFLLILVYGLQLWTVMYGVVFPIYTVIYHSIGKRLNSEYGLAILGFILAFLCGTLIDLPFMVMSGMTWKALWIRLLLGFQVSLGNGLSTFLATLFLYNPLSKIIKKSMRIKV